MPISAKDKTKSGYIASIFAAKPAVFKIAANSAGYIFSYFFVNCKSQFLGLRAKPALCYNPVFDTYNREREKK